MNDFDVVVIGSSNIDMVLNLPRIPVPGETILGGESKILLGGKGANQAVSAARAGAKVAFISKVGNDAFGKQIKTHFKKEGLPSNGILTDKNAPTGIAQIFVDENGQNSIGVAPGANWRLLPKDLIKKTAIWENSELFLTQMETPLETIRFLANKLSGTSKKLILNPAPANEIDSDLLQKIWLITPNETEASLLTGTEVKDKKSAQKAACQLIEMGVEHVIITMGSEGLMYHNHKELFFMPAFEVEAIDTTAAGDVFNGVLAYYLSVGNSFKEAITNASAAAAISVTRSGAQPSIPYKSELKEFIVSTRTQVH